eukprot:scaffold131341_cov31-Tisochrysis_lutea.AAC.9
MQIALAMVVYTSKKRSPIPYLGCWRRVEGYSALVTALDRALRHSFGNVLVPLPSVLPAITGTATSLGRGRSRPLAGEAPRSLRPACLIA